MAKLPEKSTYEVKNEKQSASIRRDDGKDRSISYTLTEPELAGVMSQGSGITHTLHKVQSAQAYLSMSFMEELTPHHCLGQSNIRMMYRGME